MLEQTKISAAIFDFDGTLSTLRCGWEKVMEPLMIEYILNGTVDEKMVKKIREYIDTSTGIQTIHQMKWLTETIKEYGKNPSASDDPWLYKQEYNNRLMKQVQVRRKEVQDGTVDREKYLIAGGERFLQELKREGIRLYAASGTDEADVRKEAEILGLASYFDEIAGAKPLSENCSKEAVIRNLLQKEQGLLIVGDGKVEIRLGKEAGGFTLGVASDEEKRHGINPIKQKRLMDAGAHAIVGDFTEIDKIMELVHNGTDGTT